MSFVGALFKKPKVPDNPLTLSLDTNAPRRLILGKTALAGSFNFQGLSNSDRDLTRIAVLAGHKCNALTRIWADGQQIYSGRLTPGVRTASTAFRKEGRPTLWFTWYDGSPDQLADPWLTTQGKRPVPWASTDRLRGCAYIIFTMRHEKEYMPTVLDFVVEVEGALLYDRRRDTTAGGSGSHRWNVPSTWEYTDNTAVATDHYQLGMVGGANNDKLIFGMGLDPWQVPYADFEASANLCDEIVYGEARYAVNGILSAADDHKDNIVKLADAMAAVPYDVGGRVLIRPQQARTVKLTLTDDDLVAGKSYELSESPGGEDLVNTVKGEFRDPYNKHTPKEYPKVEDADLISEDGRSFEVTLDLPLETSSARAQRLATIELEVQKRRDALEEDFMPIANILDVGDWFERISTLRGNVTKIYEVVDKTVHRDLTVTIRAQETDPSITAFGPDQAQPVETPDSIGPIDADRPDPPVGVAVGGSFTGGGATLPGVTVTIGVSSDPDEADRADYFEVEYGVAVLGPPISIQDGTLQTATFVNETQTDLNIVGLLPDTEYAWRIRSVADGIATAWTDYATFTTGPDLIATDAASVGGIDQRAIVERIAGVTAGEVAEMFGRADELDAAAAAELATLHDLIAGLTGSRVNDSTGRHSLLFDDGLTGVFSDSNNDRAAALPSSATTGSLEKADGSPHSPFGSSSEEDYSAALAREARRLAERLEAL